MSHRVMSVAGTFYPSSCDEIESFITRFNSIDYNIKPNFKPKAIISPHAGYIYSGFTANLVYKIVSKERFKRVIVVGPSHHFYLRGISVALYNRYDTPCGSLPIDLYYSKSLVEQYKIAVHIEEMHREHSTETQMPFIKYYLPDTKVVEIVYGDIDYRELIPIFQKILNESDTLLVVSTDLSHFHNLNIANKIDGICIEGVANLDISILEKGCEACGLIGLKALVAVAKESQIIDYRTSFDASGDNKRVVGYLSAILR